MKLKFNLSYHTAWGQQAQVLLTYVTDDGRVKTESQVMSSADGCCWTVTTTPVEPRQHRIVALYYVYQIVSPESGIRHESNPQPRFFSLDRMKNYEFFDTWDDEPIPFILEGCDTLRLAPVTTKAPLLGISRKTIVFRVKAFGLLKGETVALLGDHAAVGNWDVHRYVPMQHVCGDIWQFTLNADVIDHLPIAYKYVVVDKVRHRMAWWEAGDNRHTGDIEEIDNGKVVVINDSPVHISRERKYAAEDDK